MVNITTIFKATTAHLIRKRSLPLDNGSLDNPSPILGHLTLAHQPIGYSLVICCEKLDEMNDTIIMIINEIN